MASWKKSMINRLSNLINRNRSAAKISQVLCSSFQSNASRLSGATKSVTNESQVRKKTWIQKYNARGTTCVDVSACE